MHFLFGLRGRQSMSISAMAGISIDDESSDLCSEDISITSAEGSNAAISFRGQKC